MNVRVGLAVGGFAVAMSVGFALADQWLLAVAVTLVPAYLAGRWDRRRDREALAGRLLAARREVRVLAARVTALEDARDNAWVAAHAGRWADEARMVPDRRPDFWSAVDRKPTPVSADVTSPARPFSTTP